MLLECITFASPPASSFVYMLARALSALRDYIVDVARVAGASRYWYLHYFCLFSYFLRSFVYVLARALFAMRDYIVDDARASRRE